MDARPQAARARVVIRSGLATLFAGTLALAGAVAVPGRASLEIAGPRSASRLTAFFSPGGASLVAGRAAFVPAGAAPLTAATNAATAGALAVLLYGRRPLPAGALGSDGSLTVPVVSLPPAVARTLLPRLAGGATATLSLRSAATAANPDRGHVTSFSSTGLAFDGRVKPDLVASGVGLTTADPGANPDGSTRFVTLNGSSASAAIVAGAAALLAQARPHLRAAALAGLLAGTARALPDEPVTAQGAGLVDVGAAATSDLSATPATLAFGRDGTATFTVTNVSVHAVRTTVAARRLDNGSTRVQLALDRTAVTIPAGRSVVVRLRATGAPAEGVVVVRSGKGAIRVPWATARTGATSLLPNVTLAMPQLTVDAGRVAATAGTPAIVPVARLDVELVGVGLLARLRDVLPGRYTFALTGRGPTGRRLAPGGYTIRVRATPVGGGPATVRTVRFTLR